MTANLSFVFSIGQEWLPALGRDRTIYQSSCSSEIYTSDRNMIRTCRPPLTRVSSSVDGSQNEFSELESPQQTMRAPISNACATRHRERTGSIN